MKNRISSNEYKYVEEVLKKRFCSSSGSFMTKKLETLFQEKFSSKYAIAHCNGTATLHCALLAAGVAPGDEVIVPPLTMSSTAFAVLHCNAVPVFADVDPLTFVISPESIKKKITEKTKAIITVALYGLSPDMETIMKIARGHNLVVVEDNAQCFLGYYDGKIAGTLGDIASFSFQSSKHITCGEGGMLITSNQYFAERIRKFNSLGYAGVSSEQVKIAKKDIQIPSYERHVQLGYNFRISELCAAVALAQVERIEELVDVRKKVAKFFDESVKGCKWLRSQHVPENCIHSYWTYPLVLEHPDISWKQFRDVFKNLGGDDYYAAWKLTYKEPVFYNRNFYDKDNIFQSSIYDKYQYNDGICPNAEFLQSRLIQLKTNYFGDDFENASRQAEILKKTIDYFM